MILVRGALPLVNLKMVPLRSFSKTRGSIVISNEIFSSWFNALSKLSFAKLSLLSRFSGNIITNRVALSYRDVPSERVSLNFVFPCRKDSKKTFAISMSVVR